MNAAIRFIRLVFATPFFAVGGIIMIVGLAIAGMSNAQRLNDELERVMKKLPK